MAFCDLKPVRASDDKTGTTYVIGEVFAVCSVGSHLPTVFSWDMLKSVSVTRKDMTFSFVGAKKDYYISNKMFNSAEDVLCAIAIIECRSQSFGFEYRHERRMFPLKSLYREVWQTGDSYVGEGVLDDADIAAALIVLLDFKLMKFLWLMALLVVLVMFGILNYVFGLTRDNILYFILISVASGGISALLIFIITHAVARAKVKSFSDADIASKETIKFVVSRIGFAACESCVYQNHDLVLWSEADYFVESDKMFIIFKGKLPLAYIPKKAFPKKQVGGVADVIALSLEQR